MKEKDILLAKEWVKSEPKNIVIFPHKNPDGDAIGSTLALKMYLETYGHKASIVAPNRYPNFLKWMPRQKEIIIFENEKEEALEVLKKADLAFCLDFNAFSRVGDQLMPELEALTCPKVLIDHHQEPDEFDCMYSDVSMSSTCEMVYNFINYMGDLDRLTKDMATCIYTGILTDTGSFKFPNTTGNTHRIIADLLDLGVDKIKIHSKIEDSNSPSRLKLMGIALKNLRYIKDKRTAYITLNHDELARNYYKKGDTEGFVNLGLSLNNYIFAVIFIEDREQGITKMSFRSKGDFSVNDFARTHFEGGGHINAAGGRSTLGLKETVEEFLTILNDYDTVLKNTTF